MKKLLLLLLLFVGITANAQWEQVKVTDTWVDAFGEIETKEKLNVDAFRTDEVVFTQFRSKSRIFNKKTTHPYKRNGFIDFERHVSTQNKWDYKNVIIAVKIADMENKADRHIPAWDRLPIHIKINGTKKTLYAESYYGTKKEIVNEWGSWVSDERFTLIERNRLKGDGPDGYSTDSGDLWLIVIIPEIVRRDGKKADTKNSLANGGFEMILEFDKLRSITIPKKPRKLKTAEELTGNLDALLYALN